MSTGVYAAGAAGFEKSLFFWPNACYTLRRSDCPIPCKGTDLKPSSCKIHLKLILSNTPARGQTKMPFSVFAQWRQKRAFFMGKSLSDVREKATPPDAGLHSCTGGVFAVPLRGGPFQDGQRWVRSRNVKFQHFVPLREEHGKGVSACAHRDFCGRTSGSTDTPPMPRVVLIPMPP